MTKSQKVLAAMMIAGGVAAAAPITTAHASCACGTAKINCCCAANKCHACCADKS